MKCLRPYCAAALLLLVAFACVVGVAEAKSPTGTYEVKYEGGIKVAMTDGVKLNVSRPS